MADAEARKLGERTELDTPVVLAVNDGHQGRGDSTPSVPQPTRGVPRLGSTAARLKLKGIDGGPHKQRSVWFNSTQRAEPYQGLKGVRYRLKGRVPRGRTYRCCMAVVSSCREVLG